jgi:hypothetical protein
MKLAIAFISNLVDPHGRIKCQVSNQMTVEDVFTANDMNAYSSFALKRGYDPEVGYKIVN